MQNVKMTFAYELHESYDLSKEIAVVIDVIRATTTITYALAAGATEVLFFEEIGEARAAAERIGKERCVLGGEREGLPIEGTRECDQVDVRIAHPDLLGELETIHDRHPDVAQNQAWQPGGLSQPIQGFPPVAGCGYGVARCLKNPSDQMSYDWVVIDCQNIDHF